MPEGLDQGDASQTVPASAVTSDGGRQAVVTPGAVFGKSHGSCTLSRKEPGDPGQPHSRAGLWAGGGWAGRVLHSRQLTVSLVEETHPRSRRTLRTPAFTS